jgi:hypothetical protein
MCEMIRLDTFTLKEVCDSAGISRQTYFDWKKKYPEFAERVEQAEADRDVKFVTEARKSLLKKLTGYDVQEEKTVYVTDKDGKPVIKEQTITTRHFQPDTAAIIFTLCNKDNWTNKYRDKEGKPEPCVLDEIVKPTIYLKENANTR